MTAGLFVLVVHASCAASERKGDEPSAQKPRSAGVLSNAANAGAAAAHAALGDLLGVEAPPAVTDEHLDQFL